MEDKKSLLNDVLDTYKRFLFNFFSVARRKLREKKFTRKKSKQLKMFFLLLCLVQCFCFDVDSFKIEQSNLDLLKDCVLNKKFQKTPYDFIREKMIDSIKFYNCQLRFGVADYVFHHVMYSYKDSECKILYEHMIEYELYPKFYQACDKKFSSFWFHLSAFTNKFKYDEQIPPFFGLPDKITNCLVDSFGAETTYKDLEDTDYVETLCSCFKNGSEKFNSPYCN